MTRRTSATPTWHLRPELPYKPKVANVANEAEEAEVAEAANMAKADEMGKPTRRSLIDAQPAKRPTIPLRTAGITTKTSHLPESTLAVAASYATTVQKLAIISTIAKFGSGHKNSKIDLSPETPY